MSWDSIFAPIHKRDEIRAGLFRDHKTAHCAAKLESRHRRFPVEIRIERHHPPFRNGPPRDYYVLADPAGIGIRFSRASEFIAQSC